MQTYRRAVEVRGGGPIPPRRGRGWFRPQASLRLQRQPGWVRGPEVAQPIASKKWKRRSRCSRSSLREALNFLRAWLQIGAPASMNADASLGFARSGCQSPYIASEVSVGRRDILFHMDGTSSRGSEVARGNPARCGAEMLDFAHVARALRLLRYHAPMRQEKTIGFRGQGVFLRKRLGPRAPRFLAARVYENQNGQDGRSGIWFREPWIFPPALLWLI